MKLNKALYLPLLMTSIFLLSSCNEEDETSPVLTNEEVATSVEVSLSQSDGGLAMETETYAKTTETEYQNIESNCDYGTSDSQVISKSGNQRSYSFTLNYDAAASCNNFNIPTSLRFTSSRSGFYQGPKIEHQGGASSDFELTNLNPFDLSQDYTLNGTHQYNGTLVYMGRQQNRGVSTQINLTVENLSVDKQTYEIQGGTGTFTLNATGSGGNTGSFSGAIQFLGNGQAEVTINGETFPIDIN